MNVVGIKIATSNIYILKVKCRFQKLPEYSLSFFTTVVQSLYYIRRCAADHRFSYKGQDDLDFNRVAWRRDGEPIAHCCGWYYFGMTAGMAKRAAAQRKKRRHRQAYSS